MHNKSIGKVLKTIRKRKKLTQQELIGDCMSRQRYSKIENDGAMLDFNTLVLFLEKLDYTLTDFSRELQPNEGINLHYQLLTRLRLAGPKAKRADIKTLINSANVYKTLSMRGLNLYGLVVSYFHHSFPKIVPSFSAADKELFRISLQKIASNYTITELKLVADFSFLGLNYPEMKELFHKMSPFNSEQYVEFQYFYALQIHKIFCNFANMAIENDDLSFAEELITEHKDFLKYNNNTRMAIMNKLNQFILNYKLSGDKKQLQEIKRLAEIFDYLEDPAAAKVVLNEYEKYTNDQDIPVQDNILTDF